MVDYEGQRKGVEPVTTVTSSIAGKTEEISEEVVQRLIAKILIHSIPLTLIVDRVSIKTL